MSLLGAITGLLGSTHAAGNRADQWYNAEQGAVGATQQGIQRNDAALSQLNTQMPAALQNASAQIGTAAQNFQPYVGAGTQGVNALEKYAGSNPQFQFDPSQYFNSPAYQFQLQQGQNAITNNASAMGLGASGNTLRDLTTFGQGLASTYYNQAFNQAQNTFQTNQNATMQNLGALINTGEFGAAGTQNAADYGAGLNVSGTEALNQMNLQGTQAENAQQLQGTQMAGNFAVGYGNAMADKTMAGYTGWGNVLGSAAGLISPSIGSIPLGQGNATTLAGILS